MSRSIMRRGSFAGASLGFTDAAHRGKHAFASGNHSITHPVTPTATAVTTHDRSTRERIVTEAIRLFARHGFSGTTVGDIEQAAGLAPRAGGLYRHFRSKEEVLSAAIERHVQEMERIRSRLALMPLGDLRAELTLAARWALAELGEEQLVMKVVQKDGDRFPELVREVHARIVAPGHAQAAGIFERMFAELGIEGRNPRAIAAVALGALVDYRIEQTMFGVPPGGIGEDEFIEAWVDTWESFARGATPPHRRREK
jgi:AcrR family transcriptional regulator